MYKVTFQNIKEICKYKHIGFEYGKWDDTCRNEKNVEISCSWGECNQEVCPLLKDKKEY
jgi:hypothetical protein